MRWTLKQSMPTPRIHPELTEQLAQPGVKSLQVIVQLRNPDGRVPSGEEMQQLAGLVLDRVEQQVGQAALRNNVLKNLGTLVVEADPAFVAALIKQPEVSSALPNQPRDPPVVKPAPGD